MKKHLTVFICAVMALSLATSCSKTESKNDKNSSSAGQVTTTEKTEQTTTKAESEQSTESETNTSKPENAPSDANGPVGVINSIWNSYAEDDKFASAGGDSENNKMGEAGKYSIEDSAALDSALGFPAASADKIDSAASLMHMMNANTFTCGAFHVKDAADVSTVAAALKDNIMKRQWMCGFPDKLVIAACGENVVSFFGAEENVESFKKNLIAVYPSAEIIVDEAVVI